MVICIFSVADNAVDEKRHSSQHTQAHQTGTSRQSSRLRDEVERLSMIFSQSGFDVKSVPSLQNSQTPSIVSTTEKSKPSLSDDVKLPSGSVMETGPDHGNRQEKTVLLNTTMEMTTVSNATEIVAVETKAKKTGRSGKPKSKKKKEQANGSSVAENPQVSAPTDTLLQTDEHAREDFKEPDVFELQLPKTQCRSGITSRIPKLSKFEADNHQKMEKDIFKANDHTKSESRDIVLPDLDDYFMNAENQFSKAKESVKLPPEKDIAEETRSKVKCRRSRTKSRRVSFITRKTFVTLPLSSRESESSQSKLELVHNKVEEVNGKYEASKDQQLPEEFLFSADEEHESSPSSSGNKPQSKIVMATNSGGSHKSRCRGTFVISVGKDSTSCNIASPGMVPVEQDFVSHPESSYEAEEPSTVIDASFVRQRSEAGPHRHSGRAFVEETRKRPWVATQDSGGVQEDLSSNDNYDEVLPLDQVSTAGTEFQKPKKPRREETGRCSKKKAVQREECVDHSSHKKKKKKCSRSNKGSMSGDGACYLQDHSNAFPLHDSADMNDPGRNKEQLEVVDSDFDHIEKDDVFEHSHNSKPTKSKSRMVCDPKPYRKTSKLHTAAETRNSRETFVVYRRKTQDRVSLNNTRTSNVSVGYTSDEAVHQNLGDLLTDEMPPWLDIDACTADTEGSLLCSPKRETSGGMMIEESATITTEATPGLLFYVLKLFLHEIRDYEYFNCR